ncbi:DUF3905 domain-containing protein [Paenibacillus sp. R14(2021)]|uniref:DUF3905 domain-containing protein n=1 Tax=Paenibacillus sp. R14(2021) TaxID=2859228 RepID=UPI0021579ABE|nr:DUF3905 domain-containing protein [Paenibacillus sp. R14(2021)]
MNEDVDKAGQGPRMGGDNPELDPYEINFLPQFRSGRGTRAPFVNSSGVVIGDHQYESPESPLSQWSTETDPAVMSGSEWVHPFKDVGFLTSENRDYFEKGISPQSAVFMHPDEDAAYKASKRTDAEGKP